MSGLAERYTQPMQSAEHTRMAAAIAAQYGTTNYARTPAKPATPATQRIATAEFNGGRLYAGPIRRWLEAAKFKGWFVEWIEQKSLLSVRFCIKADERLLRQLAEQVNA